MTKRSVTAPTRPFTRVAIANRGEIACRIIETLHKMGMTSILLCAPADRNSRAARMAEAVSLLPNNALAESYLSSTALIRAAIDLQAEAIHPGYGFLSENPEFAQSVIDAGLIWIGPAPQAIALMGDKKAAKSFAIEAGVPGVPAALLDQTDPLPKSALNQIEQIGFPVLIKAAFGGGGRGMRKVSDAETLAEQITQASREATSAFGDGTVFIEKCIEQGRHIEVQILSDAHGTHVALGERDCSLQRRHQKVVEECPAQSLTQQTRVQLHNAACALAKACSYQGAGTVEFLVTPEGDFYFLEMNTRLQVEHPVTEIVFNIDLVAWQINIAQGCQLPEHFEKLTPNGHSIEVRWYAEDPSQGFLPQSGDLISVAGLSGAPQLRLDHQLCPPQHITPYYDPLLAKIIASGPDRPATIKNLQAHLTKIKGFGVQTNIGFLNRLLAQPAVQNNDFHTQWLEQHLADILVKPLSAIHQTLIAASVCFFDDHDTPSAKCSTHDVQDFSPAWIGHFGLYCFDINDCRLMARIRRKNYSHALREISIQIECPDSPSDTPPSEKIDQLSHDTYTAVVQRFSPTQLLLTIVGQELFSSPQVISYLKSEPVLYIDVLGHHYTIKHGSLETTSVTSNTDDLILAPCQAVVKEILVQPEEKVGAGQDVIAVEAMKIERMLTSPRHGFINDILVRPGQSVSNGQALVTLKEGINVNTGDEETILDHQQ
jgi:3-methylcrotonyl-CoA carboxylase alpha subunit